MKLRNKLTLLLLLLFIVILALFFGSLYYSYTYYESLEKMRYTIIFIFLACLFLVVISGFILFSQLIKPISKIIRRVEEISASNLNLRVDTDNKDEIGELSVTFNEMLERLEKSFISQKQFVSNISHELRTPLTAITTELEIALIKERNPEEYKKIIRLALNDAIRLRKLSDGLLDLAKASYDQKEIKFKEVRLDELLMDARQHIQKANPGYKVNIIYEREIENASDISVSGNEYLLKVAFINLMENGCKFSDNKLSTVAISFYQGKTLLRFSDTGIGIPESDMDGIFTPFYRGINKNYADGNGIGLSLSKIIINLHKGDISISSKVNEGSAFSVELPHV